MTRAVVALALGVLVVLAGCGTGGDPATTGGAGPGGDSGWLTAELANVTDDDGDGYYSSFDLSVRANTTLADVDTEGENPGEPYFVVRFAGERVLETEEVERTDEGEFTVEIPEDALSDLDRGQHGLTVLLRDRDEGSDDDITFWSGTVAYEPPADDRPTTRTSTATAAPTTQTSTATDPTTPRPTTPQSTTGQSPYEGLSVSVADGTDADGDGHYEAFTLDVRADTRLPDADATSPGEPYFRVEIDGREVAITEQVERTARGQFRIPLDGDDVGDVDRGTHEVTVRLMDEDLIGDTEIEAASVSVRLESGGTTTTTEPTTATPDPTTRTSTPEPTTQTSTPTPTPTSETTANGTIEA